MSEDFVEDVLGYPDSHQLIATFDRHYLEVNLRFEPALIQEIAARSGQLDAMKSPEHFLIQLAFEHEMTHWYQQIGTGYGYLQLEVEDCAARSVGTFFNDYRTVSPNSLYPRPLAAWAIRRFEDRKSVYRRHLNSGGSRASYLDSITVEPCSRVVVPIMLNRVIDLCEGDDESTLQIAEFLYSQLWRGLFGNQEAVDTQIAEEFDSLINEPPGPLASRYSAVPLIGGLGQFGARHVSEGQAHVLEMMKASSILNSFGMSERLQPYVHASSAEIYNVALDYFIKTAWDFGTSEIDLLLTFVSLCDLALSTPMHICFFPIAKSLRWRDLHPGWRFMKSCKAVEMTGTIGNDEPSLDPDKYCSFIEKTCDVLEWPTPMRMAQYFRDQGTMHRSVSFATAFFAEANAIRLDHPTVFALHLFDDAERAEALYGLPQPFITYGSGENQTVRPATWSKLDDSDQRQFAFDLMTLIDIYRTAEFLLYDAGSFDSADHLMYGDIGKVLKEVWGLSVEQFREL